jgi:hypothetical protein
MLWKYPWTEILFHISDRFEVTILPGKITMRLGKQHQSWCYPYHALTRTRNSLVERSVQGEQIEVHSRKPIVRATVTACLKLSF